ncbi:hypothetical protein [Bacillus cereus]|nr:hypothetical protein [Bacillus cereus]
MVEYVDTGGEFTIDEKVNMDGSLRFKIHNSKGETYYITINETYVYVW